MRGAVPQASHCQRCGADRPSDCSDSSDPAPTTAYLNTWEQHQKSSNIQNDVAPLSQHVPIQAAAFDIYLALHLICLRIACRRAITTFIRYGAALISVLLCQRGSGYRLRTHLSRVYLSPHTAQTKRQTSKPRVDKVESFSICGEIYLDQERLATGPGRTIDESASLSSSQLIDLRPGAHSRRGSRVAQPVSLGHQGVRARTDYLSVIIVALDCSAHCFNWKVPDHERVNPVGWRLLHWRQGCQDLASSDLGVA